MINACADSEFFVRGGWVQAQRRESSLENLFLRLIFLVLNLLNSLQRGSNGLITEKTMLFQGIRGGFNIFRGGGGGGPNANFYRI